MSCLLVMLYEFNNCPDKPHLSVFNYSKTKHVNLTQSHNHIRLPVQLHADNEAPFSFNNIMGLKKNIWINAAHVVVGLSELSVRHILMGLQGKPIYRQDKSP